MHQCYILDSKVISISGLGDRRRARSLSPPAARAPVRRRRRAPHYRATFKSTEHSISNIELRVLFYVNSEFSVFCASNNSDVRRLLIAPFGNRLSLRQSFLQAVSVLGLFLIGRRVIDYYTILVSICGNVGS